MGNQTTLLRRPHPAGTLGGRLRLVVLARRRLDNGLAGRRRGRHAALARLAVSSPGGHARQWRTAGSLKLVDGLMDQSDARRPRPDGGAAGMSTRFSKAPLCWTLRWKSPGSRCVRHTAS